MTPLRTVKQQILAIRLNSFGLFWSCLNHPRRFLSGVARSNAYDEAEIAATRQWIASYKPDTLPRKLFDLSFSRSSGPGGQNVNKVNSKATLRIASSTLSSLIPRLLCDHIESSRFFASSAKAIVISSDSSRRQSDNIEECFRKFDRLIVDAVKQSTPTEISKETKDKWKARDEQKNALRIREKKAHSSKKSGRKTSDASYN